MKAIKQTLFVAIFAINLSLFSVAEAAGPVHDASFWRAHRAKLVQSIGGTGGPSSLTATLTSSETAGNLLIGIFAWTYFPTLTVTDSLGNTWHALSSADAALCTGTDFSGYAHAQIWYATNIKAGANTITVTETGTSQGGSNYGVGYSFLEYSGVATTLPDASSNKLAPSASNAMSVGPFTLTSDDLIVAMFTDPAGQGTILPGPGLTVRPTDTYVYSIVEDNSPAGTTVSPFTATASLPSGISDACWIGVAAAFRLR